MKRDKTKDKTIRHIRLKESQILEIRPEKGSSISFRFQMQATNKINKIIVHSERDLPPQ